MVDTRDNRFHMTLSNEELAAIDDWRYANRVPTRATAVRRLCMLGFGERRGPPPADLIAAAVEEGISEEGRAALAALSEADLRILANAVRG